MTSNELGNASTNQSFNLWYHPLYTDGIHVRGSLPEERYQILLNRLKHSEQFHMFAIREPRQISKILFSLLMTQHTSKNFLSKN